MFRLSPMFFVYRTGTLLALYFVYHFVTSAMNGFPEWQSAQASQADPSCKDKWVENARNDPALKCYLTVDVNRLCKEEERNHLAWFIGQYHIHEENYGNALLGYLQRVQFNAAWSGNTGDDPLKRLNAAQRKAAEPLMTPEFKKAVTIKTISDKDVTELVRKLVRKGLIVRDDFAYSLPRAFERAFLPEKGFKVPQLAACRRAET